MEKEMMGAMSQIMKNLLTSVLRKMFFAPSLATPIPKMAPTLSWTNEVGTPLTTEARRRRLAVTKAMMMASMRPNKIISFPVFCMILLPKTEAPMAKLGAIIRVDKSRMMVKFSCVGLMSISLRVIDAMGPAALATLLAPMLKAT